MHEFFHGMAPFAENPVPVLGIQVKFVNPTLVFQTLLYSYGAGAVEKRDTEGVIVRQDRSYGRCRMLLPPIAFAGWHLMGSVTVLRFSQLLDDLLACTIVMSALMRYSSSSLEQPFCLGRFGRDSTV